ncbi:hypothetical protein GCM10023328_47000 [Modestobacter marinus]|uniref:Uncharacterized protein n=1 Tax=Modestobacter marinus TaxID=477641 RepID=A0ABQ2GBL4_9ACTN|nr:hypothetical protein GCM10011589_46770 [Modestobacter marinus]
MLDAGVARETAGGLPGLLRADGDKTVGIALAQVAVAMSGAGRLMLRVHEGTLSRQQP